MVCNIIHHKFFKKSNYFCATGKLTKDEIQKSYANQHSNKKKALFQKLGKRERENMINDLLCTVTVL